MGHAAPAMTLRYLKHVPESYFAEDAAKVSPSLAGAKDHEREAVAELLRKGIRPRSQGDCTQFRTQQ